ncbi:MEMAR_RS02690 family S-layer glycoprotein [Methanoplanus limicola]|uniref:DUF3821 domain-containing protein n=1 Tax=Methanoplanus limicola DSM 2279 TaxID=937775 RepID=H1YXS6_9EURY|nr:MEMAR_RS02690 family S-layer glycoprotein [Methanoplanus limicola]EHQ35925.1 hypothetical protein Metlim_1824 [Methanoplanus limicola DSM 2279]
MGTDISENKKENPHSTANNATKSYKLLFLAAIAVALILLISPVMAGEYGTVVYPGETVFIGESGLDITPAMAGNNVIGWYYAGNNPTTDAPSSVMTVSNPDDFYVIPGVFTGKTGTWYINPGTPDAKIVFYVQKASLSVSLFNSETGKEISNKIAIENNNIAFRLNSNLDALFSRNSSGSTAGVDCYVETPDGTTLTALIREGISGDEITQITGIQPKITLFYLPSGNRETVWTLNPNQYKAGTYKVYATCNVNSMKDNLGTVTGVTKSEISTVTVAKDTVTVTADKETVVRNNDFTVTVEGRPKTDYVVWLSGTYSYSGTSNYPPKFLPNQDSISYLKQSEADGLNYKFSTKVGQDIPDAADGITNEWAIRAETGSDGKIVIGLTTDSNTRDAVYTIRAQKVETWPIQLDTDTYDTVKVKVEKGAVTVTASGDGSYYLGEEVTFSGTDTDTNDVYLFITGPNLPSNGGVLTEPQIPVSTDPTSSDNTHSTVKTDDTWEYRWDTSGISLDAGTYTIYATSKLVNKNGLSDAKYDTVSIVIKKPFVTATTSASTISKGDRLYIRGTAEGNPTNGVGVWIFGKDYWNGAAEPMQYSGMVTATVNYDGSFEYILSSEDTEQLAAGHYFVVVQHPMYNGQFDVITEAEEQWVTVKNRINTGYSNSFIVWGNGKLQGSDASEALISAINSPDVDDTYYKLDFCVEGIPTPIPTPTPTPTPKPPTNFDEPVIRIQPDSSGIPPGETVSVSADVKLSSSGESTFPSSNSLEVYTELESPHWTYNILINGHGSVAESYANRIDISGYLLDYPPYKNEIAIRYRLDGRAPEVSEPEEKEVFRLSQLNEYGNAIPGGEISCKKTVDNTIEPEPPGNPATTGSPMITVSPDNWELLPEEDVVVNAEIQLVSSGDSTFPASHSIEAFTELDSPQWEYTVIVNGKGTVQQSSNRFLRISGYLLEYPSASTNVSVKCRLTGKAPDIKGPVIRTVLDISQIDFSGNKVIKPGGNFIPKNILEERIINESAIYSPVILPTPTPTPTPSPSPTATPTTQPPQTDYPEVTLPDGDIVYGENFTAVLSGKPDTDYIVWFAGTSDMTNTDGAKPPSFAPDQSVVTHDSPEGPYSIGSYRFRFSYENVSSDVPKVYGTDIPDVTKYGRVHLNSEGKATVSFTTDRFTKPYGYTIRMEWKNPQTDVQEYGTAIIAVTKGDVTINPSGYGSYYIGDVAAFSGTNEDTDRVYLFITGPNLPSNGGLITNPQTTYNPVTSKYNGTPVNEDNTWEYNWETSKLPLDAGTYTVYAVSEPANKAGLSEVQHSSTSVVIKKPFITLNYEDREAYTGENLEISGVATGSPPHIALWAIGYNGYKNYTVPVDNQTSRFSITVPAGDIETLGREIYVIVQHPMYNGLFEVITEKDGDYTYVIQKCSYYSNPDYAKFIIEGPNRLRGKDAADALISLINSPDIDDTYYKSYFTVLKKGISFDYTDDHKTNSTFTITGRANSESDAPIYFELSRFGDSVPVMKGHTNITKTGQNSGIFTVPVNATGFLSGKYTISATLTENGEVYSDSEVFYLEPSDETAVKPVVISSPDGGNYAFREKITIFGVNNKSATTYLYLAGKSIISDGVNPEFPDTQVISGDESTFIKAPVGNNGVWVYTWRPSEQDLAPAEYRLYAVSAPVTNEGFADAEFDCTEINLENPSVSAKMRSSAVAKGDPVKITGKATGSPVNSVAVWVLGKNYWNGRKDQCLDSGMVTTAVNGNGEFEHGLSSAQTSNLAAGQYFVVIQHPMYNNRFDVITEADNSQVLVKKDTVSGESNWNSQFIIWGTGKLQGSDAAEALIDCIDSSDVDDTYTKLTFLVEEPWIRINYIGNHLTGDNITVGGTTNLAIGDGLIVEVTSSSFQPTQKTQTGEFSGISSTIQVTEGETYNEWSMDVDTTEFIPDEYIVKVEAIEADATATTTFNLYSGVIPIPTPVPGPQYKNGKIIIKPGWNFISTPKRLDTSNGNNTAGKLFGDVNSGGHSALMYNGTSGRWSNLKADTVITPLDGIWIYNNESIGGTSGEKEIKLTFSSDPLQTPPSKKLSAGWNAVGFSATQSATAKDTLIDVSDKWTKAIRWDADRQAFDISIVNGGSGIYSDTRNMNPAEAYWVWMREEGTIAALN